MALIPPDAGIRMRMQTEANLLQPVTPAHEISSDLPDLVPGRVFTARVQEALPENTYRALVAGKTVTLALPEGAKAGDQLKLVVVDRSAKSIVAKQVVSDEAAVQEASARPYPFTRLSPAAQLIGQLLPAEGETLQPALLNRGQPLMSAPPTTQEAALQLAPTLSKAVTQSGLFYEAHQAQWVAGKLPLSQLLQEPQGQHSTPAAFQFASNTSAAAALATLPNQAGSGVTTLQTSGQLDKAIPPLPLPPFSEPPQLTQQSQPVQTPTPDAPTIAATESDPLTNNDGAESGRAKDPGAGSTGINNAPQPQPGNQERVGAGGTAPSAQTQTSATASQQVPDELRPLVQQQLEAVATQRVFWHGEVWPQQSIDWEIEWEQRSQGHGNADGESVWRTALSLTTPRLGRIDATLQLTANGVRISLDASDGNSAADLRDASPKLASALAEAGVPLLALQVKHNDEYPSEQD